MIFVHHFPQPFYGNLAQAYAVNPVKLSNQVGIEIFMADDDTSMTTAKTLWTETIMEILFESLRKNRNDSTVREILKEVADKGFKPHYIVDKVAQKVDSNAAARVKLLLRKS